MDFLELVEKRYSVRAYQDRPVEEAKLQKILEAARLAPTAANRQPFRLIVVSTQGRQEALRRIYSRDWFVQAPIIIGICAVASEAWVRRDGRNYAVVDATIAMDHLILAAANLGLGTCWVAAFDEKAAREVLAIPAEWDPVAFTPLGYPADEWKPKKRRPLSEVLKKI